MRVLVVTGGAGFIGSNFIRYFLRRNKNFIVVNIDKLTYAGNTNNLKDIEDSPRYSFILGDICNYELINYVFKKHRPEYIINFAAESHPERSINQPFLFTETNIMGTLTLLEGARYLWNKHGFTGGRFIQVSTGDVYGSTNSRDFSLEESNLLTDSPYSASKAGADLMARAFSESYGLPVIITRCCSNFGPYQNTEKFVPSCIINALNDRPIPIGSGSDVREWIHVQDHCIALIRALFYAKPGETYNIGTGEEISNTGLAKKILSILGKPQDAISISSKAKGERRYALNSYKTRNNLNWSHKYKLDEGIRETIEWYKRNRQWWDKT